MTLPNFLIIGAGKSGTTSLHHYLDRHTNVYMSPVKEPNFFAFEGEKPDFRGPGDREIYRYSVTNKPNPLKTVAKALLPERLRRRVSVGLQNRNLENPPLPPRIRGELNEVYREDILKLQDLIGRDLSSWLR